MKHNTKRLVRAALIAGIYVALCLVQQPLVYGPVQFRVSEALTLLPIFTPDAVWAVTVGCFLSNLFSMSPWDMLFGTLATLTAALATRGCAMCSTKGLPLAAAVPPVLINAVVVGLEATYIFMPETASLPRAAVQYAHGGHRAGCVRGRAGACAGAHGGKKPPFEAMV